MHNRNAILILLVVTGLVAAGMYWFSRQLAEVAPSASPARFNNEEAGGVPVSWKKAKAAATANTAGSPTVVYKTNEFRWNQLESADYREYIANLRKVGCPEPTIRDLIITDIMRLYAARRGQFYHNGREFKFWETDDKRKLKAKQLEEREKQLASIDKEIPTVLRELLGINYERELNKYFVDTDEDNRRLSFLSEDKRAAILALRDEVEGMREKITDAAPDGKYTAEQLAELKKIDAYRQKKLSGLLSGPELDQFELSTSETADRLRKDLVGFNPSEDEFRDIFRLYKEHEAKYAGIDPSDEKLVAEKKAAEEQLEAEILSNLSPTRAQEFERAKNEEYRNMWSFTQIYDLPPSTAQSLFDIEQAVKAEKQKLLEANLPDDARAEGLRAMQVEAERAIRKIIGDQLYPKFTQSSGTWIQHIASN
jgi:hypothetical protein